MIRVTHFMRRPFEGAYSVERLYEDVRSRLPSDIKVTVQVCRYHSVGFWKRLVDLVIARRYQGDVNHVTGDVHFLTFGLSKRRTVLTILDCGPLERLSGWRRWLVWLFWFWLPVQRSSALVVISNATKRELLRHVQCNPAKIRVIHCSVSGAFLPSPKQFNKSRPRLLQIGTTENKNIVRVTEAIAGLECVLVVIGRPTATHLSAFHTQKIDYEVHTDISPEDLLDEYERCDVVVFTSTYEGFGLPIVEANAMGRPVVTSNLLSMPEVAGNAACLVDPFDVVSIRAGIQRVIDDEDYREKLVQQGFENAKRFRTQVISDQYADLYREIAKTASRVS